MTILRTTITIDSFVAEQIRRMFNGNLSQGINHLLHEHLKEKNPIDETFGTFKFKKTTDEMLRETDKELWGEER